MPNGVGDQDDGSHIANTLDGFWASADAMRIAAELRRLGIDPPGGGADARAVPAVGLAGASLDSGFTPKAAVEVLTPP